MSGGAGLLVLRALGVGDLATAVPALRGLRRAFPEQRLRLAAPAELAPLVALVDAVDVLVPVDGVVALPAGSVDWSPSPRLAVNLHGRGPRSHRLLAGSDPGRLFGYACPAAAHLDGPDWTDSTHEVIRWCQLLGWYGIPSDPADLRLRTPARPVPSDRPTIIHPGAKSVDRRWPLPRYAAVARALAARGHNVVVTGSAGEWPLAAQVAERAGLPDSAVLAGRTDLAALAGLVAGARLLVSGDTGVGHLATGYGTASVLLFGPMSPHRWGPPPDRPQHRVIWHGPAGLPSITVEEVLTVATEVTRSGGSVDWRPG